MKKVFFGSKSPKFIRFWEIYDEKDPRRYLTLLKSSGVLDKPSELTPKQSALLIFSYPKKIISTQDRKITTQLKNLYNYHKDNMNKQDLVNVSWSFSKLFPSNKMLWQEIEQKLLNVPDYNTINLSEIVTLIHSFSRAIQGSDNFWRIMEQSILNNSSKLQEKDMSILTWSITNSNRLNNGIWEALETRLLQMKFNDIDLLCSIIYSYGKTNKGSPKLWLFFENNFKIYLRTNISSIKSRYFSNIVWAFAKANRSFKDKIIPEYIESWVFKEIETCVMARDITNVLWGYNKLTLGDIGFWTSVFSAFSKKKYLINQMNCQDMINLTWIIRGKGVVLCTSLYQSLCNRYIRYIEEERDNLMRNEKNIEDYHFKTYVCFFEGEEGLRIWKENAEKFYLLYIKKALESTDSVSNELIKDNIKEVICLNDRYGGKESEIYKLIEKWDNIN